MKIPGWTKNTQDEPQQSIEHERLEKGFRRRGLGGNGCGVVLLILIVFIGSPFWWSTAKRNYTIRAQVSQGMTEAFRVRSAVEEYLKSHGELPANNEEAGLPPPYEISGKYVSQIVVEDGELLKKGGGLQQVSDLKNYTLLHSSYDDLDPGWPDWSMWLAVVEADDVDVSHGIYFNQSELLIQAALDGQGVALVGSVMAESEIIAGRLIQPFTARLPVKLNYHLVTAPQKANIAKIVAFREWVLAESAYLRTPDPDARPPGGEEPYLSVARSSASSVVRSGSKAI